MNLTELKQAIKDKKGLKWNDPEPIKGNDYTITYIEDIDDDFDDDTPIFIQYGFDSEAEVFVHEIALR